MFYALRVEQQSSTFYSKMIILPNSIDDVLLAQVVGTFIEKQIHIITHLRRISFYYYYY